MTSIVIGPRGHWAFEIYLYSPTSVENKYQERLKVHMYTSKTLRGVYDIEDASNGRYIFLDAIYPTFVSNYVSESFITLTSHVEGSE